MFSSISLKNFKSFKLLDNMKIKPITVLCGANSCGKSSILQSILLLKQTKESRSINQSLLLNGNHIHLGDAGNVVYGKDGKSSVTLKYDFSFTSQKLMFGGVPRKRGAPVAYLADFLIPPAARRVKNAEHVLSIEVAFNASEKRRSYIQTAEISLFRAGVTSYGDEGGPISGSTVEVFGKPGAYSIQWNHLHIPHMPTKAGGSARRGLSKKASIYFENLNPVYRIQNENDIKERDSMPPEVRWFLRAVDDFLAGVCERVSYIGPLREEPARRYVYENEIIEIGSKGENAAYIFQTEQDLILRNHFFKHDGSGFVYKEELEISLSEAMSKWLVSMGIKGFKPDYHRDIIRLDMDADSSHGTRVNIADVGFGVSQIFPILLEGLRMPKNGTLVLEQPEIHLHPSLQMKMADYFIAMALSGKNMVIETHSDHIINRLVRRVIESDESELSDLLSIYFVNNSVDGAYLTEVEVDPFHGIVNWPNGFFDQGADELEMIMRAGISKRAKRRGNE